MSFAPVLLPAISAPAARGGRRLRRCFLYCLGFLNRLHRNRLNRDRLPDRFRKRSRLLIRRRTEGRLLYSSRRTLHGIRHRLRHRIREGTDGRLRGNKGTVCMGKSGKKLQPEYGTADLQHRSVNQRHIHAPARNGNTVDQHFAANPGTDQQACSILPGKVQVMGADAWTGNDQVAGTK